MLKFLLDEHISHEVAVGLRRQASVHSRALYVRMGEGQIPGVWTILLSWRKAATHRLTLVTYDRGPYLPSRKHGRKKIEGTGVWSSLMRNPYLRTKSAAWCGRCSACSKNPITGIGRIASAFYDDEASGLHCGRPGLAVRTRNEISPTACPPDSAFQCSVCHSALAVDADTYPIRAVYASWGQRGSAPCRGVPSTRPAA